MPYFSQFVWREILWQEVTNQVQRNGWFSSQTNSSEDQQKYFVLKTHTLLKYSKLIHAKEIESRIEFLNVELLKVNDLTPNVNEILSTCDGDVDRNWYQLIMQI